MSEEFSAPLGYDVNAFRQNGWTSVQYGSDASLYVKFYDRDVFKAGPEDPATRKPIGPGRVEKVTFCIIQAPGDKSSKWDQPAREEDKARFPRQWDQYLRGTTNAGDGVSLDDLDWISQDQNSRLRYMNVHSLEQMAAMSDAQVGGIGLGGRELRDRARLEIARRAGQAQAQDSGRLTALEAQNKQLADALKEQQELTNKLLEQLQADKPKRGRPAKSETDTE